METVVAKKTVELTLAAEKSRQRWLTPFLTSPISVPLRKESTASMHTPAIPFRKYGDGGHKPVTRLAVWLGAIYTV